MRTDYTQITFQMISNREMTVLANVIFNQEIELIMGYGLKPTEILF